VSMLSLRALPVLFVPAALLSGSGCQPEPLQIPEGCSPILHDVDCGLPFPSDFFLVKDASMPSGHRIEIKAPAKMVASMGVSADLNDSWQADGFSRVPPVVFSFGQRVDLSSLPALFDDPSETQKKGFATALINTRTGARVAHFIDVDARATEDTREALVLHVLDRLDENTRYIVAISGVKATKGSIHVPEAFRRLRDQETGGDTVLDPLRERYDSEVFPLIEDAGIAREDLQLAWDFTTGSDERALADMLDARIAGLAWLEENEPVLEVATVFEGAALARVVDLPELTFRMIKGFITGPLLVDDDDPGALLTRDQDGKPTVTGTYRYPFTAVIPMSAKDADGPARVMAFGHGFFGERTEVESVAVRRIANEAGVIVIGIDWAGMSADDIGFVVQSVGGEVSRSLEFGDRVIQGMVNWQVTTHAVRHGLFSRFDGFRRTARKGDPASGVDFIDEARPLAFLGISQGHVLGGTLAALNADIERNVLQVGGAAFTTMMFRARPFDRFLFLLDVSLPDPMDQQKLAAQMQTHFDRFDPASFAPFVIGQPLPRGPDNGASRRRVLMQMGLGDAQVPNVGSELHARLVGLPLVTPSPKKVWALDSVTAPHEGSGFAVFDLGVSDDYYSTAAPAAEGNLVHDEVRRTPEVIEQIAAFINDGVIVNPCGGACVIDPDAAE
jgi:hypothetical protein